MRRLQGLPALAGHGSDERPVLAIEPTVAAMVSP